METAVDYPAAVESSHTHTLAGMTWFFALQESGWPDVDNGLLMCFLISVLVSFGSGGRAY